MVELLPWRSKPMAWGAMLVAFYAVYTLLGSCGTEPCLDEAGKLSPRLPLLFLAGGLITVSTIGVALSVQRYRDSRDPRKNGFLERAFYNADTGALILVFDKPVTLSDRWSLTLADDARAYLEIGIGNSVERGQTSTVGGEPNSRILELAVPDGVRRSILNTVENNRSAHAILAIPPDTMYFTSPLLDITTPNGGRTLHADIDIMRIA